MKARRLLRTLLILCACCTGLDAAAQSFEEGREAYINGRYEDALEILEPLAEAGDAEAQKMLGIMYDYGQGVTQDKQRALEWYLRSAQQGQPAVQYQVGSKYFRGDDVEQDRAEAAKWWEMAANGGQVDAQFNLGLMYFRGLAIEQNDERAARLFRSAAEQGHSQAQYSLAVMYAFGRGVEKDYIRAREWFEKAAEQGVAQAQFNLGVFYENGYGVERDTAEAARWYQRAASQGLTQAEERLAALDQNTDAGAAPAPTAEMDKTPPAQSGTPAASGSASTGRTARDTATGGIRRENWVMQQPADSYTLQIGSVTREQAMVDFIHDKGLESDTAYIELVIDGITRYNGLYGKFNTYAQAEQAAARIAPTIGQQPWIRNFGILQKMLGDE